MQSTPIPPSTPIPSNPAPVPIHTNSLDHTVQQAINQLGVGLENFSKDLSKSLQVVVNSKAKPHLKSTPYKLEQFFGEEGKGIGLLRLREQVESLKHSHTDMAIRESLMQCLKGKAGVVATTLHGRTWQDILQEMELRFRPQVPLDVLMGDFYNIKQSPTEDVATFVSHLESHLSNIQLVYPDVYSSMEQRQHLLKERLFHGMCEGIKNSIRFLYKTPGSSFKELLVEALSIEGEKGKAVQVKKVNVRGASACVSDVSECSAPTALSSPAPVSGDDSSSSSTSNHRALERAYASTQGEAAKLARQVQELQASFSQLQAQASAAFPQSAAAASGSKPVGKGTSSTQPNKFQKGGYRNQRQPTNYNRDPLAWQNLCFFCRGHVAPSEAAHLQRDCQLYHSYCQEFWHKKGGGTQPPSNPHPSQPGPKNL